MIYYNNWQFAKQPYLTIAEPTAEEKKMKKGNLSIFIAMMFLGIVTAPCWSWARSVDFKTDLIVAILPLSLTGVLGAILALGTILSELSEMTIWHFEKKLVRAGYAINYGWGLLVGLVIVVGAVMTGASAIINGSNPILVAVVVIVVGSVGLGVLKLHNALARHHGQQIFFL